MNSSTNGTIQSDGERAAILFERRIPHTIARVWAAVTEPESLAAWLGHVELDPREGGSITVEAGPAQVPVEHRRSVGRILAWDPPHAFEFEWRMALVEASTIRFELTADDEGTLLKLTHRWLSVRNAQGFAPGWHSYLDRLEAHLAGNPIPDWSERFAAVRSGYGWQ